MVSRIHFWELPLNERESQVNHLARLADERCEGHGHGVFTIGGHRHLRGRERPAKRPSLGSLHKQDAALSSSVRNAAMWLLDAKALEILEGTGDGEGEEVGCSKMRLVSLFYSVMLREKLTA